MENKPSRPLDPAWVKWATQLIEKLKDLKWRYAEGPAKRGRAANMLSSIVGDFSGMPPVMKRLALVQFFSWSALFIMWINTTPVVTQYVFGSTDTASAAYNEGANWVNVLFTVYNGVAAVAALG